DGSLAKGYKDYLDAYKSDGDRLQKIAPDIKQMNNIAGGGGNIGDANAIAKRVSAAFGNMHNDFDPATGSLYGAVYTDQGRDSFTNTSVAGRDYYTNAITQANQYQMDQMNGVRKFMEIQAADNKFVPMNDAQWSAFGNFVQSFN